MSFVGRKLKMSSRQIATSVFIVWMICLICILSNVSIKTTPGQNEVIKVGLDKDFAPFEWGNDNEVRGFDVDLMNHMAEDMNQPVEYYPLIWDDVLESVKNETIDVLFATDTPERREFFDFSVPILYISNRIYVQENVFGITNIHDLANHTVAVCNLYATHEYIKENVPEAHLVLVNNIVEGIEMLSNGEVFAFFTDYHTTNYYIVQRNFKGLKVIGDPIILGPFCMGVKKGNHELLAQLNVSLTNVINSGKYDLAYEKWFGTEIKGSYPEITTWLFVIFLALIGGFGLLLLWNYSLAKSVHKKTQELKGSNELTKKLNQELERLVIEEELYHTMLGHFLRNDLQKITFNLESFLSKTETKISPEKMYRNEDIKSIIELCYSSSEKIQAVSDIFMVLQAEEQKKKTSLLYLIDSVTPSLEIPVIIDETLKKSDVEVEIDERFFREMITNIFLFISHTNGKEIKVSCFQDEAQISIVIVDNNCDPIPINISTELSSSITENWVSLGHYLRITLVSAIARKCRGKLIIKPLDPVGNEFRIVFPEMDD